MPPTHRCWLKPHRRCRCASRCPPFGPVTPHMLVQDPELWTAATRSAVVWASPEGVSEAYKRRLAMEGSSLDEIAAQTQQFVQALARLPGRVEHFVNGLRAWGRLSSSRNQYR